MTAEILKIIRTKPLCRFISQTLLLYCFNHLACSESTLEWVGRIAAITGAALLCEGTFARIERGIGLPHVRRLAYFPQVSNSGI